MVEESTNAYDHNPYDGNSDHMGQRLWDSIQSGATGRIVPGVPDTYPPEEESASSETRPERKKKFVLEKIHESSSST